jgi:hypothetical protein
VRDGIQRDADEYKCAIHASESKLERVSVM